MHYDQQYVLPPSTDGRSLNVAGDASTNDYVLQLPDLAPGLALEDEVLKHVRVAYEKILGDGGDEFMIFEDRAGVGEEAAVGDEGEM